VEDENECECGCECDHHENGEELNSADFDEFLDEPIELDVPDPIQIDPALAAEWERRLAESFREDARLQVMLRKVFTPCANAANESDGGVIAPFRK
jgi:hypothetical protein